MPVPYADLLSVVAGPKAIAVKSLADLDGSRVLAVTSTWLG